MKCCNHDCAQSDRCPIHLARMKQQPATPPLTAGSCEHCDRTDGLLDDTGLLILQGMVLLVVVVSVIAYASTWFGW